jgi:hypothetical protein
MMAAALAARRSAWVGAAGWGVRVAEPAVVVAVSGQAQTARMRALQMEVPVAARACSAAREVTPAGPQVMAQEEAVASQAASAAPARPMAAGGIPALPSRAAPVAVVSAAVVAAASVLGVVASAAAVAAVSTN